MISTADILGPALVFRRQCFIDEGKEVFILRAGEEVQHSAIIVAIIVVVIIIVVVVAVVAAVVTEADMQPGGDLFTLLIIVVLLSSESPGPSQDQRASLASGISSR